MVSHRGMIEGLTRRESFTFRGGTITVNNVNPLEIKSNPHRKELIKDKLHLSLPPTFFKKKVVFCNGPKTFEEKVNKYRFNLFNRIILDKEWMMLILPLILFSLLTTGIFLLGLSVPSLMIGIVSLLIGTYLFFSFIPYSLQEEGKYVSLFDYDYEKLTTNLILNGVYDIALFKYKIFVCENPSTILTEEDTKKLHSAEKPALVWKDKSKQYFVYNIPFSDKDFLNIFKRENIGGVMKLINTEQRTAAIKHFGYDKILKHTSHNIIDRYEGVSDVTGKPIKYELIDMQINANLWARFVRVECHTTHKVVCLGVPRRIMDREMMERSPIPIDLRARGLVFEPDTCKKAIAWTFGFNDEEDYGLDYET